MNIENIELQRFKPKQGDLVIAADGGYLNLQKIGYSSDLIIGDFDSLEFIPQGENVIRLPKEKNDTDTLFAVKIGLDKGYKNFVIYGGIGGRLDHTFANIQTLAYIAEYGGRGFLVGEGNAITAIKNSEIEFSKDKKGIISVFCNGSKATGVYLTGLKYPLINYTLTSDMPLGVSNEFIGIESSVSVRNGMLIIIYNL
ncbi:MAG: thiamine diphosphokinase [Clostridiales bacterium GWF2_36_10]|nr:MAG: thiamine diphosphokinase [Clostridiales bacterium GWF2_36_10]HAN20198.1 thiamine diphosphokinase [Clostridiales bacterium]